MPLDTYASKELCRFGAFRLHLYQNPYMILLMTPPEYAAAVAAEIRAEMARQRKTQADLARALDITPPTAARRLSGEAPIDVAELMQIALWLGVPVTTFSPVMAGGAA